ncbi:MAG: helix-turn-helix transcriptional regulator [Cyclobacteriaceae bacterium]
MEEIISRIVKSRKSRGLSQENVATALGITKGNYNRLEKGHTSLTYERLMELCKIFDCPITYLLAIDADPNELHALKDRLKSLSIENEKLKKMSDRLDKLVYDKSVIASTYAFQLQNLIGVQEWCIQILKKFYNHGDCELIIKSEFKKLWDESYEKGKAWRKEMKMKPEDRKFIEDHEEKEYRSTDFWMWLNSAIKKVEFLKSEHFLKGDEMFSSDLHISNAPFTSTTVSGTKFKEQLQHKNENKGKSD